MKKLPLKAALVLSAALLMISNGASAQQQAGQTQNSQAQQVQDAVERTVDRFGIGVQGGVGLDPELIMFGAHGTFAPIFHRDVSFRPGVEFGVGEITTLFGINLDVLYTLPGATRATRWMPYVGAGPNFSVANRGFESDVDDDVESDADDDGNRFDFSDTDFEPGFNFVVGARAQNGLFVEMRATAYGVSNIRLLAGFDF